MIKFLNDEIVTVCGLQTADIKKWMSHAMFVRNNESPCLSRNIGCIIVDPDTKSLVSSGHNGPPDNIPSCDDGEYLSEVVWPQLTGEEKRIALCTTTGKNRYVLPSGDMDYVADSDLKKQFRANFTNCGVCPRKYVGAASGQRLELCSCLHGETSAIVKAHRSVADCVIICACGVPCLDCTKLIIESKLAGCICIDNGDPSKDYSPSSRFLFDKADIVLALGSPDFYGIDDE